MAFNQLILMLSALFYVCGAKECDPNWHRFENKCYYLNETKVFRETNKLNCEEMNATMVSVHSQQENDFLRGIMLPYRWYWLGATRVKPGSHIVKWDDGSPYNYSSRFHNINHVFIATHNFVQIFSDGDWMFYHANDDVMQICQKWLINVTFDGNSSFVGNETMKGYEVDESIPTNVSSQSNFTAIISPETECDENWTRFENKCFFLNETKTNRDESARNCEKMNATLASIHSETENAFITNLMPENDRYSLYWIGGRRRQSFSVNLRWDDGSRFNYSSHWYYIDILDFGKEHTFNYVQMRKNGDWSWAEQTDPGKQICQKYISTPKDGECELHWYRFGNKCIWKDEHDDYRNKNRLKCEQMNATMVSIHSKEENEFIAKITEPTLFYWLGGQRTGKDDPKNWDDDTPFDYNNWRENHLRDEDGHNCMQFKNGSWIYYHCTDDAGLLCQKWLKKETQVPTIDKEELNKLMNTINDKFDQINGKVSEMSRKFSSINSTVFTAVKTRESVKNDLNIFKDSVESRLLGLSNELSKLMVKDIKTNLKCKSGWTQWKNKCYYIDNRYSGYDGTVSTCQRMNATPVAIRSAEENEFIRQTFTRLTFWLGGKRVKGTEQWKWPDGSDILYTNWNKGEPNNLHTEECIQYYNNGPHSGYWNDYPCNTQRERSLCEIVLKSGSNDEKQNNDVEYTCNYGWMLFEQKCYLFNQTEVTRDENEKYCKGLNSNLVSVQTKFENNFLVSKITPNMKYWSGGKRNDSRYRFTWSDGSVWNYSNWMWREPASSMFKKCVVINYGGRFSVAECSAKYSQMCAKPAIVASTNDSNSLALQQLSEMKNEISDLLDRMNSPQSLRSDQKQKTKSTTHIYVFSILFLTIFAVIAYFAAIAYKNRRKLLTHDLLDNNDSL